MYPIFFRGSVLCTQFSVKAVISDSAQGFLLFFCMPKGRDLKGKLRHYATSPRQQQQQQQQQDASVEAVDSVSQRIALMRIEQVRAERNRRTQTEEVPQQQVQQQGPQQVAAGDSWIWHHDRVDIPSNPPRAPAGPYAPPSWRAAQAESHLDKSAIVPLRKPVERNLGWICAEALAKDKLSGRVLRRLPIHAKQVLLRAYADRLTDTTLPWFAHGEYNELYLEGAHISLKAFARAFYRISDVPALPHEDVDEDVLSDDWEAAAEESDQDSNSSQGHREGYIYDPEQFNDTSWYLSDVIQWLASARPSHPVLLSTPLASHLVSLNISFIRPAWPVLTTAYLISNTMPHLSSLSMAGTFPAQRDCARALSILARGLSQLRYWDIGYHAWMDAQGLCTQWIDWQRDLRLLDTLVLEGCGSGVADQVRHLLRSSLSVQS